MNLIPTIIIHNGNTLIKPCLSDKWGGKVFPSISDPWKFGNDSFIDFDDRINYFCTQQSGISDIIITGPPKLDELIKLKENTKIIKVVSGYQTDLSNLDPSWDHIGYDEQQWLRSMLFRLSMCDEIIWWDQISFPNNHNRKDIVFTPGRCGTHLLLDVLGFDRHRYIHHNGDIIQNENFQMLTESSTIYAVLRRNFLQQTLSDLVADRQNMFMLTTKKTMESNKTIAKNWQSIEFDSKDCFNSLSKIIDYVDFLLGLKYYYNKKIVFTLYEDLEHHYDLVNHVKNPIDYKKLISNFHQAEIECNRYQKFYDSIINNLISTLGISLFHV